jgi:hypothetical protein
MTLIYTDLNGTGTEGDSVGMGEKSKCKRGNA